LPVPLFEFGDELFQHFGVLAAEIRLLVLVE
jgi:hypothetical protein